MQPIIEVRNLSKKYRLSGKQHGEDSLRELLVRGLRAPFGAWSRPIRKADNQESEWLWALRDINFDVHAGETIGFIGANGAGKSTLLKIFSRITDPTEGEVRLRGRLASLLEVGTGFHPELTGRENIFLNGAMLGMTKTEIKSKFDEIVAFAEMQKFLDMPVKRYSSGMYVRLAFAVAAHLDPEILVVDEVLAVGDMAFQKKCLGKMGDFRRTGRTVLFVSHNVAAVENLCQSAILLRNGEIVFNGGAKQAVLQYVQQFSHSQGRGQTHAIDLTDAIRPSGVIGRALRRLEVYSADGKPFNGILPVGGALRLSLQFHLDQSTADFDPRIIFTDLYGRIIFSARGSFEIQRAWGVRSGNQEFICEIPQLLITPGEYCIEAALAIDDKWVDDVEDALRITIVESDYYGTGALPKSGICVMEHHWRPA